MLIILNTQSANTIDVDRPLPKSILCLFVNTIRRICAITGLWLGKLKAGVVKCVPTKTNVVDALSATYVYILDAYA